MKLLAFLIAGRAHIQDYSEPSTDPHSAAQRSTRHDPPVSNAGIPVIAACTKADLVDDNTGIFGAGLSEIGDDIAKGMVGNGGEHQREPANTAHNLSNVCASLDRLPSSFLIPFYTAPQPTALNVLRIRASCPIRALSPHTQQRLSRLRLLIISIRLQPKTPNRDLIVVPARSTRLGKIAGFGEKGGARPESANVDEKTLARYL